MKKINKKGVSLEYTPGEIMNKYESLGIISQEQKQIIWNTKMSGSQIKTLLSDPLKLYEEKLGIREREDLNAIAGLSERLDMGNYMEAIIIDIYKDRLGLDIKTDKSTFQSVSDEFLTANIDGYIGEDINNIDYIVEVKNTSVSNERELVERYLPQVDYYMMFFNVKKGAKFLFFTNGYETKVVTIERSPEREKELLAKIEEFKDSIIMHTPPQEFTCEEEVVELEGLEQVVEQYNELKAQEKQIKAEINTVKETIESSFGDSVGSAIGISVVAKKIPVNRKGSINYQAMAYELAEKHQESIIDLENKHSSPGYTQYQIRLSKKK